MLGCSFGTERYRLETSSEIDSDTVRDYLLAIIADFRSWDEWCIRLGISRDC